MKYLLILIISHAATYYAVGAIIDSRLQHLAEDLRHNPYAPSQAQYLEDVRLHAQHSKIEYCAVLGTLLAALLSLITWVMT
ncbi:MULTISPECIES: hypothetical protein [Pseudomonas]|uniref:Uncharacterized protein n=1 Tax=Pseudomonas auratipiscis TaxID=3115853 RepID=A0AB35X1F2_9PSED|nr:MULTISPECIES: hypothetical protein [unclassified Pseudomonas]MEE1869136.1 hypothetical protein [Pseudomonas sp. 120P]MEE1959890.1 hypothetical protein [Pseudomonas sp. 119P]